MVCSELRTYFRSGVGIEGGIVVVHLPLIYGVSGLITRLGITCKY